jgi:small subunit ribosomal protein S18
MHWVRVRKKRGKKSANVFAQGGMEPRPAYVDYKDVAALKRFLNPQGKLLSRKRTGISAAYQRALKLAIKRARFMALLPYHEG